MKKLTIILLCIGFAGMANAAIKVDFTRVYVANAFGSSNYDAMWNNAQYAVTHNLSSYDGFGSGIGEFKETAEVTGIQSYVTSYESWNGAYAAGEYGGRASWVYHIYDDTGAAVNFNNITKEYFDDYGGDRESTYGWGPLGINSYDSSKFVGIKEDGSITTDSADTVYGFIGFSGNSWWHGEPELDTDDWDYIKDESSPYWDDRFDLLAAAGAEVEQYQTLWGFEIAYDGEVFTAPDIAVVPEPATMALFGLGGLLLRRRKA